MDSERLLDFDMTTITGITARKIRIKLYILFPKNYIHLALEENGDEI